MTDVSAPAAPTDRVEVDTNALVEVLHTRVNALTREVIVAQAQVGTHVRREADMLAEIARLEAVIKRQQDMMDHPHFAAAMSDVLDGPARETRGGAWVPLSDIVGRDIDFPDSDDELEPAAETSGCIQEASQGVDGIVSIVTGETAVIGETVTVDDH